LHDQEQPPCRDEDVEEGCATPPPLYVGCLPANHAEDRSSIEPDGLARCGRQPTEQAGLQHSALIQVVHNEITSMSLTVDAVGQLANAFLMLVGTVDRS
jgi:hypothetical protein